MKTFLEYVAEDIIKKYGHDLSRTAIVFPNKRAALFINEHLARLTGQPIWSPAYITISDLFTSHATRAIADSVKLVCDLHQSYIACTGIDETLDHFYGWGQLLLSDFDDIDKNMADADRVFANLRDIHELDDVSYLTDEQRAIIKQFFSNFSDEHNSELKERFLKLWSHFADIYHDFNQRLEQQNLAYEGALYRQVATDENLTFDYDRYLFVGFNLLHQVERRLFKRLRKEGKAFFYWDFDHYYMSHEAGHFLSQYLDEFPNELDIKEDAIYRQFQNSKTISYISAPTENIQARYVSTWLKEHQRYTDGKRTAIILCDEQLLPVVIHCIPQEVEKVNVTTGYPLALTPAASLVNQLMALQIGGYRPRLMTAIHRHPYYRYLTDELLSSCETGSIFLTEATLQWIARLLRHIAQQANQEDHDGQTASLRDESLFRMYTLINRLVTLVNSGDLTVDLTTLQRLVHQLIQSTSIPFHGEPAEGIQIMGVLESRNLDFDHVLMLSCNEGNMPKGVNDSSFIPHSLRKAYELTTVDHKTAIYAYYFHRILQRASDITLVYNNATDEGHTGEMSRFMLQLLVESGHPVHQYALKAGQQIVARKAEPVKKTPAVLEVLADRFVKKPDTRHALLTPTAINTYRRCPLSFFYRYVGGLKEMDDEELQIDDRIFGIVFHAASQYLYQQMMQHGHRIEKQQIQQVLQSKVAVELAVDKAFHEQIPNKKDYSGLQLINREVIIHYVRQLLRLDLQLAPFTIHALEYEVIHDWTVHQGSTSFTTTIGGSIDRLDAVIRDQEERIRVIDYKTGGGKLTSLPDVESIFATNDSHNGYYLQTLLYSSIVREDAQLNREQLPVSPALLFIQHSAGDDYDPTLCFDKDKITDVQPFIPAFKEMLQTCVDEIFNPDIPFQPVEDQKTCRNCPYAQLCSRG
ncbi:MAG: PD-(D/E)XK nuclease family protein [Prevotella sp.]|nr:PD-(D/E)XK nuclease family protein [Prevotella sp.]